MNTFAVPILSLFAEVLIGYCNNLSNCYWQLFGNKPVTMPVGRVNQQKLDCVTLKI